MTLPVAILAGGLATRLGDVTKTIPKALLDVAGKPFIVHQLELLRAAGVTTRRAVHRAPRRSDRRGARRWPRVRRRDRVLARRRQLLGTGGALRNALPLLGDEFLVLYGDSYLLCDYAGIARAWQASGKLGLMTVYKNDGQYDASNVEMRDGQIVRYDKSNVAATDAHRLGPRRVPRRGIRRLPRWQARPRADLSGSARQGPAVRLRGQRAVLRDRLARRPRRDSPPAIEGAPMSYARQHLDESKTRDRRSRRRRDREDGRRPRRHARARRPAVLPRRRRQRRQLLARGQRLPQDRRLRGLRADRQRLRAHRAHERRGLGDACSSSGCATAALRKNDTLFVFSVGGGNVEKNISRRTSSTRSSSARRSARASSASSGATAATPSRSPTRACVIPTVNDANITPHSEAFQAVVWHLLVSHPKLKKVQTKWESTAP